MADERTMSLFADPDGVTIDSSRIPPVREHSRRPAAKRDELVEQRRRGEVVVRELPTKELLNRCENRRMPFAWTINPYRGCEFACTYCYARPTHEFLGYPRSEVWERFEKEIWAKLGGEASLSIDQIEKAAAVGAIAIGTATDPYQSAEEKFQVTRRILSRLAEVPGLDLSITTKSPLVARDVDLLWKIARRSRLTVHLSFATVDDELARRLEPRAPSPKRRLETIRSLAQGGIAVGMNLMPIVPGLTDSETSLRQALAAGREYGARFASSSVMFMPQGWRIEGWAWLIERFPEMEKTFGRFRSDPASFEIERERIHALARRLIHEFELDGDPILLTDAPRQQQELWSGPVAAARPRRRAARRVPFRG